MMRKVGVFAKDQPTKTVAGTGQLSRGATCEKKPEKGVALSRARAQYVRPHWKRHSINMCTRETYSYR